MSNNINNREHNRFQFTSWTWGKVVREFDFNNEFKMYKLHDLSQGGISLITHSPEEFRPGQKFVLKAIEGKALQKEIVVIVKYIANQNDEEGNFRVGCEFLEVKKQLPFVRGFSSYGFQP